MNNSQKQPSINDLDIVCAKQAKAMHFTSIMTIRNGFVAQGRKHYNKGIGKKGAGVAAVSAMMDTKTCTYLKHAYTGKPILRQ